MRGLLRMFLPRRRGERFRMGRHLDIKCYGLGRELASMYAKKKHMQWHI